MSSCAYGRSVIFAKTANCNFVPFRRIQNDVVMIPYNGINRRSMSFRVSGLRASMVDSYESSSNFVKRVEKAWLIAQQPRPIACCSCNSEGHVECKWCGGTGFFIIGDNMLCQVPSRNTSCVICSGRGSMCCSDCKGTGFRAKWLGEPPILK